MYWLIDNESQLNIPLTEAFIEIIPVNGKVHSALGKISLVFYRSFIKNEGFLIPISHNEARSFDITAIFNYTRTIDKIWTRNKKQFLHFFEGLDNIYDLSLIENTNINNIPIIDFYHQKYNNLNYVNCIIPISKHYENCENIFQNIKNINRNQNKGYYFYNKSTEFFQQIEKNGLGLNLEEFNKYFNLDKPKNSIKDSTIYTQYNQYTLTRRPSNSFNGINFAALDKTSGCRKSFIPKNDYFVEIDISSYHPTLISKLINYDFEGEGIYEHFSKLFKKDILETKKLLFAQIYGGITEKYKQLEFFSKIQNLIDNKWNQFQLEGKIECTSGYLFERNKLGEMNPNKLFNYILQELETSNNILLIEKILDLLKGKKSKLILYTYDSFLIDVLDEESYLIEEIKDIFKKEKLTIKTKKGLDYSFS